MPPAVNRSNAKHWEASPALTEYYEFAGRDQLDVRGARVGGGRGPRARLGPGAREGAART